MAIFSPHCRQFLSSKNLFSLSTAFLAVVTLLASGCHPAVTDPKDPKFIVAEKGNWKITRAELDAEMADYLKQHQMTAAQIGPAKMPMFETAMLDNAVLKKIFLDKAAAMQMKDLDKEEAETLGKLKSRYPSEDEFQKQLQKAGFSLDELKKRIHEDAQIHRVLEAEAYQNADPAEQEVNDFYLKNKEHFNTPAKVRASRILILVDEKTTPADKAAKKKAIDKAHARIVKGEDFAKVAAEVSEDQYSKSRGGDINFFQRGENEPQFDEVAFNTKQGALSAVFETPMGYQFLKVTDVQPAGEVPMAQAAPIITNYLRQMKKAELEQAYTKKLLADKTITFHLVRVELPQQPPQGLQGGQGEQAPPPANASAPSTNAPVPAPAH
jgi:peptidyl-prolyl cis-trans isomerase C